MVKLAAPWRRKASADKLLRTFNGMRDELVSTLYFLLGSQDDAQDAAQEAFLKCWRGRDQVPEIRNLRAWIFRVGLNAAKDLQRNAWRRRARPLARVAPVDYRSDSSPPEAALHRETLDRVRDALVNLRPEEREIFLLRQNGVLTYEEIGALRRIPSGTVKTQMRSAVLKLRHVLQNA